MSESFDEQAHSLEPPPAPPIVDTDQALAHATQSDETSVPAASAPETGRGSPEYAPAAGSAASPNSEHPDSDAEAMPLQSALPSGDAPPGVGDAPAEGRAPTTESAATLLEPAEDVAAENARLREENARLQRELGKARTDAPYERPRRVRRFAVGVLLVLTCVGVLLSSLTLWVNSQFLNTANWVELVGPLAQNPQVVDAVSGYTGDQVVSLLDVQQRAKEALPPRAEFLAAPLTTVIHDFTQKRVAALMHTPQFEQVWIAANRSVHAQVLAALRGETKNVIIENGTVTLNLIPIITEALQSLRQSLSGLIPANVRLPDISQLQIPSQARARLSQALGVQVPANFGVITLFSSEQLAKAQQALQIFDLLIVLLPIVTVLLLAAAIWFSLDRRRSLIQLGIGIAITFLIVRLAIGYLQGRLIDGIANPTGKGIAGTVIPAATSGLLTATVLLLVAGVVTTLIAYLVGKPEWFAAAYAQGKAGYGRARDEIAKRRTRSSVQ